MANKTEDLMDAMIGMTTDTTIEEINRNMEKVEWVCNNCSIGPCFEYERNKPTICEKGKGKPAFQLSKL